MVVPKGKEYGWLMQEVWYRPVLGDGHCGFHAVFGGISLKDDKL